MTAGPLSTLQHLPPRHAGAVTMGCLSHSRKQTRQEFTDHKWDYINLADFKAKGCGPGFVYGYLWFSLILSIAVYGVDSFTAVNLLAFDRWSSKIKPAIPIDVSKWIFSGCIIASFVNLAYEASAPFASCDAAMWPSAIWTASLRAGSRSASARARAGGASWSSPS